MSDHQSVPPLVSKPSPLWIHRKAGDAANAPLHARAGPSRSLGSRHRIETQQEFKLLQRLKEEEQVR